MTNPNVVPTTTRSEVDAREKPPWRVARMKAIVVLPAFNEEGNLGALLEAIDENMHDDGLPYEVVVVDDGSIDGTVHVAEDHMQHMPIRVVEHGDNKGLGAAIRTGLQVALLTCMDNDIVVVMDADNTQTPGLIRRMIGRVREGADIVVASRYQHGSLVKGVPFHRRLLSLGASYLLRMVFPIPGVKDFTCGYRAYRSSVLKAAFAEHGDQFVSEGGFQCMVDILLKLRKMDLVFAEVPMILRYDVKQGLSKMKVMQTVFRTLGLLLRRRIGK